MTIGSPVASAAPSPAVDETKAICFPSGDHVTAFPVPGSGELVPAIAARKVVSLPSGCAIQRPCLSPSALWNAIHLLSPDHSGPLAGLSPPRRTLFSGAQIHHPELAIRPPGAIAHRYRIGYVAAVGRERYAADGERRRERSPLVRS